MAVERETVRFTEMGEGRAKKAEGRNLPLRRDTAALELRGGAMKKDSPEIGGAAAAVKEPWSPGARSERQLLEFHVHGF